MCHSELQWSFQKLIISRIKILLLSLGYLSAQSRQSIRKHAIEATILPSQRLFMITILKMVNILEDLPFHKSLEIKIFQKAETDRYGQEKSCRQIAYELNIDSMTVW